MIGYLKGRIKFKQPGFIILDINNIGFKVFINISGNLGDELEVFTHHHIREDVNDLYGFQSFEEMAFFEQLLSVSGVGPKMAMAILTIGSVEKIKQSIIRGDTTLFTTVSGVGKKVAAKIIVELKNKIGSSTGSLLPEEVGEDSDLMDALEQLGYKKVEILPIIRKMPEEIGGTQAKLTWVLQQIKK